VDVGGEFSGTVTGTMNMVGSLAASASPIIFGVLTQRGFWIAPFLITAGVLLTGALIWTFFIDPEKSVVEGRIPKMGSAI
jgi:MFS family permease